MTIRSTYVDMDSADGSGGGPLGAARRALLTDAVLAGYFGTRVWTALAGKHTVFPILILEEADGDTTCMSDGMNLIDFRLQVTVYAEGYNPARELAKLARARLQQGPFLIDGRQGSYFPRGGIRTTKDDGFSETGRDVYQSLSRFAVVVGELVRPAPGSTAG